ncbi:MAG: endonuclease/exonuclease/phosphatase family protein [Flavobacteriaceae bacterium]|nr:endonuclease/exonuclease/phosphatase family protein [Flavobacteriaceae bacterium]
MKKLTFLLVLASIFSFSFLNFISDPIKIISYNIRYNNPNDGKDIWENRRETITDFIEKEAPDFLGLQEVNFPQIQYLNSNLINYSFIGVGRDDGKTRGEFSPIYFDESKYNLLLSNTFWLSKTPDNISVGWDAAMERICTYGLFKQKNDGSKVWVFNTHFDHIGNVAREKSVDLILSKIKDLTKDKDQIIITGDFNLSDDSVPIKKLQNFYNDVNIKMDNKSKFYGTFNNFKIDNNYNNRIDYIFYKNFDLIKSSHLHIKTDQGRWASDHHPVIAILKI